MTIRKSLEIRLDMVNSQIEIYKKHAIEEIEKEETIPATSDLAMLRDLKEQQRLIRDLLKIEEE